MITFYAEEDERWSRESETICQMFTASGTNIQTDNTNFLLKAGKRQHKIVEHVRWQTNYS